MATVRASNGVEVVFTQAVTFDATEEFIARLYLARPDRWTVEQVTA